MGWIPSDIRQALRRLAATPLLSLGAAVTLALGIGSAVVMVDVLDRLLLRPPAHVTEPDRVARVYINPGGVPYMEITDYATFEALASMKEDVESAALFFEETLSLGRGRDARSLESVAHSSGYFSVLGFRPALGSWGDLSSASHDDAAVISYGLWQRAFGGSTDVLGKPLRLGLDTYTIAAVAPRGFAGTGSKAVDVWLPLARRAPAAYGPEWKKSSLFTRVIVRLKPGVSRERASARATAAYRAVHDDAWAKRNEVVLGDVRAGRVPWREPGPRVEVLVAGMSILVLLITCGNVANLLLLRGLRRDREFVVKTALGASRPRLLWEVLLEAALLAAGAGVLSLAVVAIGGTLMRDVFLSDVATLASPIDTRVVLVTAVFCVAAAFLLGLAPALRLTTRRALRPGQSAVVRPSRVLDIFSGLQVALTLPLITAATLFVLSLWHARHQDFGMSTDRVTVVTTNLYEVGRPWDNHAIHRQIQARVARLPQVESTALVQNLPMRSFTSFLIEVPGRPMSYVANGRTPSFNGVDPSFFAVMRMRLVEGRVFTDAENRKGGGSVAVITESMARDLWPGESAIGKCFYLAGKQNGCTHVVGVLADARIFPSIRPTKEAASACYLPIEQWGDSSSRALLVRTTVDPYGVLQAVRREAQSAVPDLPYVDVHPFDDIFLAMLQPWRLGSIVFVIFGGLSMIVAGVGLAVVAAYGVTRRTREIGIRSALGAAPGHLVFVVLARSLLVVGLGLVGGLALAWATGHVLNAQLFDVRAGDPRALTGAAIGLLLVGCTAAWVPARRAARIDPSVALRVE